MHRRQRVRDRRGFTLIELLVVIAIIAILAVVVVLTLNPAELLRQSRDSNRLSDMATISEALGVYTEDVGGSLGVSTTIYISTSDTSATSTAGDQCQGLGLSSAPTGFAYHCAASTTNRNVDGTGWVPVNFKSISSGAPIGNLPVDPINQTSSNLFYTYTSSSTQYEIAGIVESQKYRTQLLTNPIIPNYPEVAAQGNSPSIAGLWSSSGLLAYWPLNQSSGNSASDSSGNGYAGTLVSSPSWVAGKFGNALQFNGGNYVTTSVTWPNSGSISAWIDPTGYGDWDIPIGWKYAPSTGGYIVLDNSGSGNPGFWRFAFNPSGGSEVDVTSTAIVQNQWSNVIATWSASGTTYSLALYLNGKLQNNGSWTGTPSGSIGPLSLGTGGQSENNDWPGILDDVRIYNRALSGEEAQALYYAQK
jgi:prepilin-type N-terminal cleavage/methylation domain-containing protein